MEIENSIFQLTPIYPKGNLEKEYESYYKEIINSTKNLSNSQLQEYLYNKVLKSTKEHDEVTLGLLYSILTHPTSSSTTFQTLTIITKDFFGRFTNATVHLVYEYYSRLSDVCREQIFWLLNELLQGNVANASHLLIALLRCISAGNFSKTNLWAMKQMFYVVNKHRQYLSANSPDLQAVIYCYMNLLVSQIKIPELASFVDEETEFLLTMIYNNFDDCIRMGKDFVRLLHELLKCKAFEELWSQIANDPKFTNPTTNQSALVQMLNIKTSRRLITIQIPYDIEKKLIYITSQVRQYQQHYYSEWLLIQHFSDVENLEIIPSLIRFICCVIHPSNEIISSDIVQRWALIGQLLFIAKDNALISDSGRFALFYDWLFFDHQPTSIMNLEPAILLIYNSFESHPLVSLSLIEFLCTASDAYLPEFCDLLQTNVNGALKMVIEMKAIPSIIPLIEFLSKHPKINALFERTFSSVIDRYAPNKNSSATSNQLTRHFVEKRSYTNDNNIPYKLANQENSSTPFISIGKPTVEKDRYVSSDNVDSDSSKIESNNRGDTEKNSISGYTYALSHNHTPKVDCDFDSITEFNRIQNEAVRKGLIHINSSGILNPEIEKAIETIFNYANELELASEPLRDISCCFAYSRANDLLLSVTFSDLSILFYIFNYFCINFESPTLGPCLDFIFSQWHYIDCRLHYAFMYYLVTRKHSLRCYYNYVKNNEKVIKSDIKTCYDHDLYAFEAVIIYILYDMPKLILNDTGMCEILIKFMNPTNCSNILTVLTRHQFNSGIRLDNITMIFLLKNSTSWDIFTEEMFYLLLRTFRFQFDVDFLAQYLEDSNHNLTHHLLHHLANGTPNLKLFSKTFMKNFNESYKFIVTQWLLRFPSMMISVICQWLFNNTQQLQSICSLFCYLFESNENDSIKAKLKSDQSFTKVLQFVSTNYKKLTDEKLLERTKIALEMIDKVSDISNRKKRTPTTTGNCEST